MDPDEAAEDISDIEMSRLSAEHKLALLRQRLDALGPDDPVRPIYLDTYGERLQMAGRFDEAREVFEASLAAGGDIMLHPRGLLLALELEAGDDQAAERQLEELFALARANALSVHTYEFVAETLEAAGRPREALRWFTMPLRTLDPEEVETSEEGCVDGRYRVRRALGLPLDGFDRLGEDRRKQRVSAARRRR